MNKLDAKEKSRKRRSNIIYRARKKGLRINTKNREIECVFGEDISGIVEVRRLRREFGFYIQLTIG